MSARTRDMTLEDVFFMQRDQELLRARQEMAKIAATKEALSSASGITDDGTLSVLMNAEIRPETLAALMLVPLIEVAWADGEIQPKELDAIMRSAEEHGVGKGSPAHMMLTKWLRNRPPKEMIGSWVGYIDGLRRRLRPEELALMQHALLDSAGAVAAAAGGFLGLTDPVSANERKILDLMRSAFEPA